MAYSTERTPEEIEREIEQDRQRINAKLDEIRARGKLLCGVNTGLLGFSARTESGLWAGLDADFCRALAAAVFADASKAEFVPLETNERFDALKNGKIDVLSRNTTWTMNREVDMGLSFGGVLYFDGQGFMTSDATRSLDTAVSGSTPNTRTSSGVMSAPPPMPVRPTTKPTPSPPSTSPRSTPNPPAGRRRSPPPRLCLSGY